MPKADKPKELFTASEVARFCQVDLKTIHNWADRGEIRHFRTPGRHLRFRRADVLDFLRKYGYPIPDVLMQGRPRVAIIDEDSGAGATVEQALSNDFEVRHYQDPIDALLHIGAEAPDVVLIEESVGGLDAARIVSRLRETEATRHVRAVLFSENDRAKNRLLDAGASAHVSKADPQKLRETLEALVGLER